MTDGAAARPGAPSGLDAAAGIVAVGAVLRLAMAGLIPVFPDEAYYWDWSRHLAPGYFDHPYGVAALIHAGEVLLAPLRLSGTAFSVRLFPVLAGVAASVGAVAAARTLGGAEAARRAALILTCLPLAAAGLVLATPDVPLLAWTAITLYCLIRALTSPLRTRASLTWWALGGVALGFAFSSKYTSILLPVGVLIGLASRRDLRTRFTEPGPYVACLVATAVFSPVLAWNARHGWISFAFQLQHGLGAGGGSHVLAALKREGDLLGGQAGLASPIIFVLMAMACARGLRRTATPQAFLLAVVSVFSFGFFVYSALRQHVEANWPAPAYISAIVLVACTSWSPRAEKWLRAGVIFAAVLSAVIYVQSIVPILPLRPPRDPIARAFGWPDLTARADAAAQAISAETGVGTWLGGDRYQEAAEIALHDRTHPTTFAVNLAGRSNQYDLWPRFPDRARVGQNLVLALDDSPDRHPTVAALAPFFDSVRRGELDSLRRGSGVIGIRRLWTLVGWRGGWPR